MLYASRVNVVGHIVSEIINTENIKDKIVDVHYISIYNM